MGWDGRVNKTIDNAWRGKCQRELVRRAAVNAPGAARVSVVEVRVSPRRFPLFDPPAEGANLGAALSCQHSSQPLRLPRKGRDRPRGGKTSQTETRLGGCRRRPPLGALVHSTCVNPLNSMNRASHSNVVVCCCMTLA